MMPCVASASSCAPGQPADAAFVDEATLCRDRFAN